VESARTFTAAVTRDGEWYVARCLEVEVTSQGETVNEDDEVTAAFEHPLVTRSRSAFLREPFPAAGLRPGGRPRPEAAGFEHTSTKGSHAKLRHPDGRVAIVPLHRSLARGTFASILRQAGLSTAQFVGSSVSP
jgi:predicted RNA binding protein YcfA (HicA-like mRNA interferase family)